MINHVVAKNVSSRFRLAPRRRDKARHMRLIRFLHEHGWEPEGDIWRHRCRNAAKNFHVEDLFMAWHALGERELFDLLRCVLLDVPESMQCREHDPIVLSASILKAYEADPRNGMRLMLEATERLRVQAEDLTARMQVASASTA